MFDLCILYTVYFCNIFVRVHLRILTVDFALIVVKFQVVQTQGNETC